MQPSFQITLLGSLILIMKEERWKRCHGGVLHPTLNPNELKCNYCGSTRTEVNLADYVASNGYVGP